MKEATSTVHLSGALYKFGQANCCGDGAYGNISE